MSEHEKNLNEHVLFTYHDEKPRPAGSFQRSGGVYCQNLK